MEVRNTALYYHLRVAIVLTLLKRIPNRHFLKEVERSLYISRMQFKEVQQS